MLPQRANVDPEGLVADKAEPCTVHTVGGYLSFMGSRTRYSFRRGGSSHSVLA